MRDQLKAGAQSSEFVARGVWKVPYLVDGSPAAMAVDSKQRRVAVVVLHPGVDRRAVKRLLMQLLDEMDPQPAPLSLLK